MAKEKALGRGLNSILDDEDDDVKVVISNKEKNKNDDISDKNYKEIPLSQIEPNPQQPRKDFIQEDLDELVASIKEHGVIQPIIVDQKEDGTYLIVAGERRYRASKVAGLDKIPAVIKSQLTDEKILELALIENIQRSDLSPIEEALAYKQIMELEGIGQEELAKRVGKKRASVANSLRLLKLSKEIQSALIEEKISVGHAKILLSVVNPSDQKLLYNTMIKDSISVREAERLANLYNAKKKGQTEKSTQPISRDIDPQLIHIQNQLMTYLGTKVFCKGNLKNGKIEIDYYSSDDLERILDLIIK